MSPVADRRETAVRYREFHQSHVILSIFRFDRKSHGLSIMNILQISPLTFRERRLHVQKPLREQVDLSRRFAEYLEEALRRRKREATRNNETRKNRE